MAKRKTIRIKEVEWYDGNVSWPPDEELTRRLTEGVKTRAELIKRLQDYVERNSISTRDSLIITFADTDGAEYTLSAHALVAISISSEASEHRSSCGVLASHADTLVGWN